MPKTRPLFRAALVVGLLALAAAPAPAALAAASGEQMFRDNCSACHQMTGMGIPGAFPALAGDPFVLGDPRLVAQTMLNGRGGMPAFKGSLSDAELAAILTYVRGAWGNRAKPVGPADFAKARTGPSPNRSALQAH